MFSMETGKNIFPLILAIEGINGSGKTTLIKCLKQALKSKGYNPVDLDYRQNKYYKEITSGRSDNKELFIEAFKDSFMEIRNTLSSKDILIVDRYIISYLVYREIDIGGNGNNFATDFLKIIAKNKMFIPDTVVYLDCPTKLAAKRILSRDETRFNSKYLEIETLDKARKLFIECFTKISAMYKSTDLIYLNQNNKFWFSKKYLKFAKSCNKIDNNFSLFGYKV